MSLHFDEVVFVRCVAMVAAELRGDGDGRNHLLGEVVDVDQHIRCLIATQAMMFRAAGGTADMYTQMLVEHQSESG